MKIRCLLCVSLLTVLIAPVAVADVLDDLARDFWAWRAAEMPVSTDDIPRLDRPAAWVPDWSPAAVESYRKQVGEFERGHPARYQVGPIIALDEGELRRSFPGVKGTDDGLQNIRARHQTLENAVFVVH